MSDSQSGAQQPATQPTRPTQPTMQPAPRTWWAHAASSVGRAGLAVGRGARTAWVERQRAVAALNGVVGDTLAAQGSTLALKMALLDHDGARVLEEGSNGRAAIGRSLASGRLCLFVHGNCDCERGWWRTHNPAPAPAREADAAIADGTPTAHSAPSTYAVGLRDELGYAPLYLRYNSGLHISDNGQRLDALLERFADAHGALDEIAVVSHSMGGLVIRSACYYGALRGASWIKHLRRVVFLGVPHDGAHLERLGRLATLVLSFVPGVTTQLIAAVGERRSAGIKDLRHGYLLDEEWSGDGGGRLLPTTRRHVPPLPGVVFYIGAATLADTADHWTAHAFGDGTVHLASALGRRWMGRGLALPDDNTRIFPSTSHLGLMRSDAVYEQLRAWLA